VVDIPPDVASQLMGGTFGTADATFVASTSESPSGRYVAALLGEAVVVFDRSNETIIPVTNGTQPSGRTGVTDSLSWTREGPPRFG
jgi:hypothetical protein